MRRQQALSILDQHRRFCEPDLMHFLAEAHPEIPLEHQFLLLIGAMAGAQFATQLHVTLPYTLKCDTVMTYNSIIIYLLSLELICN